MKYNRLREEENCLSEFHGIGSFVHKGDRISSLIHNIFGGTSKVCNPPAPFLPNRIPIALRPPTIPSGLWLRAHGILDEGNLFIHYSVTGNLMVAT